MKWDTAWGGALQKQLLGASEWGGSARGLGGGSPPTGLGGPELGFQVPPAGCFQ